MPSFHPRIAAVAALLVLSAGLSGCGGSSDDDPSTSPSVSPSAAPTSAAPSPTKKPKAKPLSRFEGRPQVKTARAWAAAFARDINAKQFDLPRSAAFETSHGRVVVPNVVEKSDKGSHYPGPLPFTPVAVNGTGSNAQVTVCLWERGWGEKHGRPAARKKIGPAVFIMQKVGGTWRVDDLQVATADCAGVKVKGVRQ